MELLLSVPIWCVVMYCGRVAIGGNPLYSILANTDPRVIEGAEGILIKEGYEPSDDEVIFLKNIFRWIFIELALFLLEIGLLIFCALSNQVATPLAFGICIFLLAKNMLMIAISIYAAQLRNENNRLFKQLLDLPKWLYVSDRVSALLSAVGFLILFVEATELFSVIA